VNGELCLNALGRERVLLILTSFGQAEEDPSGVFRAEARLGSAGPSEARGTRRRGPFGWLACWSVPLTGLSEWTEFLCDGKDRWGGQRPHDRAPVRAPSIFVFVVLVSSTCRSTCFVVLRVIYLQIYLYLLGGFKGGCDRFSANARPFQRKRATVSAQGNLAGRDRFSANARPFQRKGRPRNGPRTDERATVSAQARARCSVLGSPGG
jgi:hypothetical protein